MASTVLKENALENRGGLAVEITGKFESMRHALARADRTKVTAGEAAQLLREKGFEIKASELVDWYRLTHDGLDPEWHHAGRYQHGMAKTYFFSLAMVDRFSAADMEVIERLRKEPIPVFRVGFVRGIRTRGGCRIPIAQFFLRQGRLIYGDKIIPMEEYQQMSKYNGTTLKPYESYEEFRARMLAQNNALETNNK